MDRTSHVLCGWTLDADIPADAGQLRRGRTFAKVRADVPRQELAFHRPWRWSRRGWGLVPRAASLLSAGGSFGASRQLAATTMLQCTGLRHVQVCPVLRCFTIQQTSSKCIQNTRA